MAMPESELMKNYTVQDVLDYKTKTRPSIWSQRYTRLRGKVYRFEQRLPDGSLDLRRAYEIPRHDANIGLRGQRQFLQKMLDDQHPHKATQKSRQCGASENEVRETLWFSDTYEYTKQAYVFPTFDQVADFSKTRIDEVMRESPYVRDRMGYDPLTGKKKPGEDPISNVGLRKMGANSWIFFRSGHTPKAGEGIDCDKVTFDEIDRMHPNVMIAFNETLSSSAFGWRRDVSTPSLPGVGVNYSFQKSDQQHWFMKCPHCGNWFTMIHEFPKCVVELKKDSLGRPNHNLHLSHPWIREDDTHAYICVKCGNLISDETRVLGVWHAIYPHIKTIRGYQISQLMCAWISATQLMKKREDYQLDQLFMNYVIGLPYLGDNILLTMPDILRCVDRSIKNPYDFRRDNVVVGGDWGNQSWGVAAMQMPDSQKKLLLDIWMLEDRQAILGPDGLPLGNPHIKGTAEKMRQWQAKRAVFDAGYGKDKNWDLMQTFPGKVFSCFYPNLSTDVTKNVNDQWNEDDSKVNVDRTTTLLTTCKEIREGKWVIPEWVAQNPLFPTFIKHLTNLVQIRDIEEDEKLHKEIIKLRVGTLPGGDHFSHAMNYVNIGLRKMESTGKSDFFA